MTLILALLFAVSLLFGNGVELLFGVNIGNIAKGLIQIISAIVVLYLLIDDMRD